MNIYKTIVDKFPSNILYSFAYGSAVKPQLGQNKFTKKGKLIDLIFCVDNPTDWHKKNLCKHRDHYSSLKYLNNNFISLYQQKYGAKVYYNTLVEINKLDLQIKYGVIGVNDLIKDLINWDYLYISGRLHKPVTVITRPSDNITYALKTNLESALRASLLILPENFSDYQLFLTISNLSYKGDFRMIFGENKKKVENIVKPQLDQFFDLYLPAITEFSSSLTILPDQGSIKKFTQDKSNSNILKNLNSLPTNVHKEILKVLKFTGTLEEALYYICNQKHYPLIVTKAISNIVWKSSINQSVKNIPTAGINKSLKYCWRKFLKTFE